MCYEQHKFFCLNCGGENVPLMRPSNHRHKDWHRKKLYCPKCRCVLNHVEIKNEEQKDIFLTKFSAGDYIEEAQESIKECEKM